MRKFSILNCLAALALLFSVAFQSVHGTAHLMEEFYGAHCVHRDTGSKHNFAHTHHTEDHCFVCHFSLSGSVPQTEFQLAFQKPEFLVRSHFFHKSETAEFFSGSLFSHRGPPQTPAFC